MDDFDLKCLPTDFVGTSRPSKVIEALYEKKEIAEKKAIEEINIKKQEICVKYEKLFEEKSEELKRNLNDIRGYIKFELFESKIHSNHDNAQFLEKNQFKLICRHIQAYTRQQHNLVDTFYMNMVKMESDKSSEFTVVLKKAYDEIKRISFKLPSEYDEQMELQIEKVNQTILCNIRNYMELKSKLQAEIQNYTKNAIQELQYVKECWVKYIRTHTGHAIGDLKSQYTPHFIKLADTFTEQLTLHLKKVDSVTKIKDPMDWLDGIRHTLATLDQKAQQLLMTYKQATVIIYNRFFQELKVINEAMAEMVEAEQIPKAEEMYTPTLEEITNMYDMELETIQTIWNDLVDQLTKIVDNTYKFLAAATTLWERHFKRTELLQEIILQDMENTVKLNDSLSEPYETKLNVLLDTLRQEATKEKAKKTWEDIKKMLANVEALYKSQYQSELGVLKKYKATQELKVDILLAEINRFLVIYPPDRDRDPKIQRKRASQTSEIANPAESVIPNQLLYCKYQIGAITNWQFGLWECIDNYVTLARTEILAETEKWIQKSSARVGQRLEVRMGMHALRLENMQAYIYEERLEELCLHQSRFDEHKVAIERRLDMLKDEFKMYQDTYDTSVTGYGNEISKIETESLDSHNSYAVASLKPILNGATERCIDEINGLSSEYVEKCDKFFDRVKASNIVLIETLKLFSEKGNFSVQEIKETLKNIEKIEAQVDKVVTNIKKEVDTNKEKIMAHIHTRNTDVNQLISAIVEEHRFTENLNMRRERLQKDLLREVCALQYRFKIMTEQFEESKVGILENCGNYSYFKEFATGVKDMAKKLTDMAAYLDEAVPVRFYSDKSASEIAPGPAPSGTAFRARKTEAQRVQEITEQLFNFEIKEDRNTLFINLNKILKKYWEEIIIYGKDFFTAHHRCFFLDEDKVHHSLIRLLKKTYKIFFHMQNQCETRSIQDTKEYLHFASNYITFIQEYTEMYMAEFARTSVKSFEQFFEEEVREVLYKNKADIQKRYIDLEKKLKPLYGHPKNKKLLEKLQIEAEIVKCEVTEFITDVKSPLLEKLDEEFNKILKNYYALKKLIPDITKVRQNLQLVVDDLIQKLNEKVNLLRMVVHYCPLENSTSTNQIILSHCKSFLTFYDSKSLPYLGKISSLMDSDYDPHHKFSFESDSSFDSASKSPIPSLSNSAASAPMSLATEETDMFPSEIKEYYDKYYDEIENENYEEILETSKREWSCAVNSVLDLYTVKYDQYRA